MYNVGGCENLFWNSGVFFRKFRMERNGPTVTQSKVYISEVSINLFYLREMQVKECLEV